MRRKKIAERTLLSFSLNKWQWMLQKKERLNGKEIWLFVVWEFFSVFVNCWFISEENRTVCAYFFSFSFFCHLLLLFWFFACMLSIVFFHHVMSLFRFFFRHYFYYFSECPINANGRGGVLCTHTHTHKKNICLILMRLIDIFLFFGVFVVCGPR